MLIQISFSVLIVVIGQVLGNFSDSLLSKFHQSDYKLEFEHIELIRYNKLQVKQLKIVTFKHNRTCAALNITFETKFDASRQVIVAVQAYKFASNEYRLFPMRFQVDLCDMIITNALGTGDFIKCGNFKGCPIVKGMVYHLCNFTPDEAQLPPFFPSGRYMMEMNVSFHSNEIFVSHNFARVYRPIPIPN